MSCVSLLPNLHNFYSFEDCEPFCLFSSIILLKTIIFSWVLKVKKKRQHSQGNYQIIHICRWYSYVNFFSVQLMKWKLGCFCNQGVSGCLVLFDERWLNGLICVLRHDFCCSFLYCTQNFCVTLWSKVTQCHLISSKSHVLTFGSHLTNEKFTFEGQRMAAHTQLSSDTDWVPWWLQAAVAVSLHSYSLFCSFFTPYKRLW